MNISSSWLRSYLGGQSSTPLVISTTGSSGNVKEIEIPAAALIESGKLAHEYLGAKPGDSWSILLPTNHVAGINVLARSILLDSELKKVDQKADFTSIVPTQLHKALNGDRELLDHLKNCKSVLVGGARLSNELFDQGTAAGINIVTTYGSTETCGGCVYNGTPLRGIEIQINSGKISLRVPYMNHGDWISTNDLGHFANGKLVVDGRSDDVIISGGENISLIKLEKFLESIYPNQNFLATNLPDDKWGERIGLLCEGQIPEDLKDNIEIELGKFYIPKRIKSVTKLPLIGIGKYDRRTATEILLSNE